jgi:hypothetical protein
MVGLRPMSDGLSEQLTSWRDQAGATTIRGHDVKSDDAQRQGMRIGSKIRAVIADPVAL